MVASKDAAINMGAVMMRVGRTALLVVGCLGGLASGAFAQNPPPNVSFLQNGDFSAGTNAWSLFATPDMTYMPSSVTGGVFEFDRLAPPAGTTNQAVIFQQTGFSLNGALMLSASLQIGNTEAVRKRISVLLHDSNFSDRYLCTFWLPPGSALQTYQMSVAATFAWTNATMSIYAASVDGGAGSYQLDNVSLLHTTGVPLGRADTLCTAPASTPATGGVPAANIVTNGTFGTGALAPWTTFGQITGAVTNGVFDFMRLVGTPAGVVFQQSGRALVAGQTLAVSLSLGNSSASSQRVTVLLHDADFSDLSACTFRVAAGQAVTIFPVNNMYATATKAWANATISVYPANDNAAQWLRLDDVQFSVGAATGASNALRHQLLRAIQLP